MAAINSQIRTSHESAGVAEQEYGGTSVVLGLAELVQHIMSWPLRLTLRELHKQLLDHLGDD